MPYGLGGQFLNHRRSLPGQGEVSSKLDIPLDFAVSIDCFPIVYLLPIV